MDTLGFANKWALEEIFQARLAESAWEDVVDRDISQDIINAHIKVNSCVRRGAAVAALDDNVP